MGTPDVHGYLILHVSHLACQIPLGGDKVSMLTHTYPYKPLRNTEVAICNHQTDSRLYVWPDAWSGDLQV